MARSMGMCAGACGGVTPLMQLAGTRWRLACLSVDLTVQRLRELEVEIFEEDDVAQAKDYARIGEGDVVIFPAFGATVQVSPHATSNSAHSMCGSSSRGQQKEQ